MVLDNNLFKKGKKQGKLLKDTIFVLEQVSSTIKEQDITGQIENDGYYGSFNVSTIEEIIKASGRNKIEESFQKKAEKQGKAENPNVFSYNKHGRGLIFSKIHSKVNSIGTMMTAIRYNGYQQNNFPGDPSNSSPMEGISSRGADTSSLNGGADGKVVNSSMIDRMEIYAVSGPVVTETLKPIKVADPSKMLGVPKEFNFKWYVFNNKIIKKAEEKPASEPKPLFKKGEASKNGAQHTGQAMGQQAMGGQAIGRLPLGGEHML